MGEIQGRGKVQCALVALAEPIHTEQWEQLCCTRGHIPWGENANTGHRTARPAGHLACNRDTELELDSGFLSHLWGQHPNMDASSSPGCSTSDLIPCLWLGEQERLALALRTLYPLGKPGRSSRLLSSEELILDCCSHLRNEAAEERSLFSLHSR